MAASMMTAIAILARVHGFRPDGEFSLANVWLQFKRALWALMMPVLILVGFRMGLFTATEIAGVAAAYALIVGFLIYRSLSLRDLPRILVQTARETAVILFIVAAATPFSWILGIEQAPQLVVEFVSSIS